MGIAGVHQLHVGSLVQWLCVKVQGTLCSVHFKLYEAVNCCCQKRHHVAEGGSMYAAGHLHRCLVLLKHAMWGMCDHASVHTAAVQQRPIQIHGDYAQYYAQSLLHMPENKLAGKIGMHCSSGCAVTAVYYSICCAGVGYAASHLRLC